MLEAVSAYREILTLAETTFERNRLNLDNSNGVSSANRSITKTREIDWDSYKTEKATKKSMYVCFSFRMNLFSWLFACRPVYETCCLLSTLLMNSDFCVCLLAV